MRKAKRLPLDELAPFLFESTSPSPLVPPVLNRPPVAWREVYGNDNPVEVEVGCGKGLFLITAASACPKVNFFGIEIVRKYQLYTATRVAIRNLHNVRVACADARMFFRDRIPVESLQAIHAYFPDPWWKKRHHKRRLFTPEFVELCRTRLRSGGLLHVATDVDEYFQFILHLCREQHGLRELPTPQIEQAAHDLDYLTNFERKARKEGKTVRRLQFQRVS